MNTLIQESTTAVQDHPLKKSIQESWDSKPNHKFSVAQEIISNLSQQKSSETFLCDKNFRKFLIDLQTKPEWYKKRIADDFFEGSLCDLNKCVNSYFRPALEKFFHKLVHDKQKSLTQEKGQDIKWEDAISKYVQDGKFNDAMDCFCKDENLNHVDLDFCSKIFYKIFKEHFDSRTGSGFTEMIEVGKVLPEELDKMNLMKEFDDIRSTLLRLQLTGKISSLNYQ